jgi:hypothetical protein
MIAPGNIAHPETPGERSFPADPVIISRRTLATDPPTNPIPTTTIASMGAIFIVLPLPQHAIRDSGSGSIIDAGDYHAPCWLQKPPFRAWVGPRHPRSRGDVARRFSFYIAS